MNEQEAFCLRRALAASGAQGAVSDAAWTMRHAFDSILDGSVQSQQPQRAVGDDLLLDFEAGVPEAPQWICVDDVVMGGMSSSTLAWDPQLRAAVFTGNVTEANNGGFASVRTRPWAGWRMAGATAIKLMVKGDGRVYKLQAQTDADTDGVRYEHDFATQPSSASSAPDGWQEVTLPLAAFRANFRGQFVPSRPPLEGSRIRQLGVMVSKFGSDGRMTPNFRAGQYRLAVKWMRGIF